MKHELKSCPRCQSPFECKVGSITQCQCWQVKLTLEERQFIQEQFSDCLCTTCMEEVKHQYQQEMFVGQLKKLGKQF
ncbi:cysteine-rich CWC family protein [Marinoscillum pacificum]|uniref:cysteine-rich CWC family protein n=1 Tax=Marinoscillum pacificum TaxID=392723 RepID=UPI00358FC4AD